MNGFWNIVMGVAAAVVGTVVGKKITNNSKNK